MSESDQQSSSGVVQIDPDEGKSAKDTILEWQMQDHEREILMGAAPDSFRGIRELEFEDLGIDIVDAITGKLVADMGSGYGGLAKTAKAEEISTTIYSVNPHLAKKEFKGYEEENTKPGLKHRYPEITDKQIKSAQEYHDSHLSTSFAHDLRDFENNFFDLIIDNKAVHEYMPYTSSQLYERTIMEYMRVLKPGGRIFVGDSSRGAIGTTDVFGQVTPKEKILQSLGVRYEPKRSRNGNVVGAIIYKD